MTHATVDPRAMPTLMDILKRSAAWLTERGIENARLESEWIFAARLGLSRLELYTSFDMPLSGAQLDALREDVRRRGRREPLAYILGTQPFAGLELHVDPRVLVPRPETEELVEHACARWGPDDAPAVLDVGTGSGAIALACKSLLPAARVTACDISPDALAVARGNAERLGLAVTCVESDLLAATPGPWDLILANPPYVGADDTRAPELDFEPPQALFAGRDGLAVIERLLDQAPEALAAGGRFWCEIGAGQAAAVGNACAERGLTSQVHTDAQGLDRMLEVRR